MADTFPALATVTWSKFQCSVFVLNMQYDWEDVNDAWKLVHLGTIFHSSLHLDKLHASELDVSEVIPPDRAAPFCILIKSKIQTPIDGRKFFSCEKVNDAMKVKFTAVAYKSHENEQWNNSLDSRS